MIDLPGFPRKADRGQGGGWLFMPQPARYLARICPRICRPMPMVVDDDYCGGRKHLPVVKLVAA